MRLKSVNKTNYNALCSKSPKFLPTDTAKIDHCCVISHAIRQLLAQLVVKIKLL